MLVTVMTLGKPELGVPPTPYSVSPVMLSASVLTLEVSVVGFKAQRTLMFVTFALPTLPDPLVTVQV